MKRILLVTAACCSLGLSCFGQSAVETARSHLADRDFEAMKTGLDEHLNENPSDEEARFLRAIARLGVDVQAKTSAFLESAGATTVEIDAKEDLFEVEFDDDYRGIEYFDGGSFNISGKTGTLPRAVQYWNDGAYYLSYGNQGPSAVELKFKIGYANPLSSFSAFIDIHTPSDLQGYFWMSDYGTHAEAWEGELDWDTSGYGEQNHFGVLTVTVNPGDWVTFEVGESPAGLSIAPRSSFPATVVISTGRVPEERLFWPKLSAGANLSDVVALLSELDQETFTAVLADLDSIESTDFEIVLTPSETGSVDNIVIAHTDARLLTSALRAMRANILLMKNFNLSVDMTGANLRNYQESAEKALAGNPSFLKPAASDNPAERQQAKVQLEQAIGAYFAVEEVIWTREPSLSGQYLFALSESGTEREEFNSDLETFRESLSEMIIVPGGDPNDQAFVTLGPLFDPRPVDIRSLGNQVGIGAHLDGKKEFGEADEKTLATWLDTSGFVKETDSFGLPRDPGNHDRELPIFGKFNDRHFDHNSSRGWIRHTEHDWLYLADAAELATGGWLWDHIQQAWVWTGEAVYPFFYNHVEESWIYYEVGGTPAERWFYFYDAEHENGGEWRSVKPE